MHKIHQIANLCKNIWSLAIFPPNLYKELHMYINNYELVMMSIDFNPGFS